MMGGDEIRRINNTGGIPLSSSELSARSLDKGEHIHFVERLLWFFTKAASRCSVGAEGIAFANKFCLNHFE